MNKILISFLMALLVVVGTANASLTAVDVTISVEEGNAGTGIMTLNAADNVSVTNIESVSGLTGTAGDISSSRIDFDITSFNITGGESQNVSVDVDSSLAVMGTYTGDITVSYDNGSTETLQVGLTVTVTESTVGSHLTVPTSIDFGVVERTTEDDRNELSKPIVITNTGDDELTNFVFSSSFAADYEVTFSNIPSTLAKDISQTITMVLVVPADVDAGTIDGQSVTVTASGVNKNIPVTIEAENYLKIDDIEVKITHQDGDTESEDGLDDGDTVDEDVNPGDEVEIIISVENDNNLDIDIDDVEVEIDNDEMDVREDEKIDIKERETEDFEFVFDVDDKADDGKETLKITVSGTDDEGAYHELTLDIDFNIEELNDFISIESVDFPSTVRCGADARLEVVVENIGTDDQSKAAVRIEIPQLDIIDWERDIDLDEGDDDTVIFNIAIPEDAREGSYFGEVEAFYDRDEKTDEDSFDFSITCGTSSNDEDEDDSGSDDIIIIGGDDQEITSGTGGTTPSGSVTAVGKEGFFESTGYLVLLTVLVVILIVVIVGLLLMGKHKA